MKENRVVRRSVLQGVACLFALTLLAPVSVYSGEFAYRPDSENSWPRNLVRAVQVELSERGFDPGPADGLYGVRTMQAIQAYQRAEGMDVNGKISSALITSLNLD